jgi:hypothetical protein
MSDPGNATFALNPTSSSTTSKHTWKASTLQQSPFRASSAILGKNTHEVIRVL